ncbi:MAG: SdhA, partial [Legionella sp.]
HYYVGLIETLIITINTAKEKRVYLDQLKTIQEKEQQEFIENYTSEAFVKHLDTLCNRHIGLQYTDIEYRNALRTQLLTFKAQIISKSKKEDNIDRSIINLLQKEIGIFEKDHYEEYYQLDSVRDSLAKFRSYFKYCTENKNSLFENKETLDKKSLRINVLEEIATNARPGKILSIKARLHEIREEVKDPNFERIILAYKHPNTFSFAYLKICFFYLLETLHLYTPTKNKLLNNLKDSINNRPKIDDLVNRFGLFSQAPTHSDNQARTRLNPNLIASPMY